jgi:hypothetical protein
MEQKEQFERDGFIAYGPIISADELNAVRERIDAIADGNSSVPDSQIRMEQAYLDGTLTGVARRDAVW